MVTANLNSNKYNPTSIVNLGEMMVSWRKKPLEQYRRESKRYKQMLYLMKEDLIREEDGVFLKEYIREGTLGVLSMENLIKCIGYIGTSSDLKSAIQKDLFESLGKEKLSRFEKMLS